MIARAMREPTPASSAILERWGRAIKPAVARLSELLAQAA